MKRTLAALVAILCLPQVSAAGEPPSAPILRIDTGMHTAIIRSIGVDATGRYLATGSMDKTVRIWDLAKPARPELLKVLRPPIGTDPDEGKVYAMAMSPDGKTVACGGWTGYAWDSSVSIYLFQRESGQLERRITGLPQVVDQLAYSPDGRFLGASLAAAQGIRIYRAADLSLVGEDTDYGSDSSGIDFFVRGSQTLFASVSHDGFVRLYRLGARLEPLAKVKAHGGSRPSGIHFSPSGDRVAVGFGDSMAVDVYSSKDLAFLFAPSPASVGIENLGSVAWSHDGQTLFAGGRYFHDDVAPVLAWRDPGKGALREIAVNAKGSILDIRPLGNGGFAFGSGDPAFGVVDGQGTLVAFKGPDIADFSGNQDGLRLAGDGTKVAFAYEAYGKSPALFLLSERRLELEPGTLGRDLSAPVTAAEGISITDWRNSTAPKLNGTLLELNPYEPSRSLAMIPGSKDFILGAEWSLRRYDEQGKKIWENAIPGSAWAANVTADGRLAVVALGDGTIRWYRASDGVELLAFFPHRDKKHWVVWTPSGYYDASAGADRLIGWHLNRGKDQAADFFPVSQFREKFYRPDVVSKILVTLDEQQAIEAADTQAGHKAVSTSLEQMLPPVITLVSPVGQSTFDKPEIVVRYRLRTPADAPVTNLRALIDGRPMSQSRGIKVVGKDQNSESAVQELSVSLPERDCELALVAENRHSASEPVSVSLRWAGQKKAPEEFLAKPKLYVLSIGVSRYDDQDLQLGLAAKDASDFARAMEKQKDGLYREVVTRVLTDAKAQKDEVLDGLDWIQKETTSRDVAMIFIAGHGVHDPSGVYYFLPANANLDKLKRTGVAFSDIKNTIASLAGKAILFIDTCHSGDVMGTRRGVVDIDAVVNELTSSENGAVVFASSTGRQYSMEDQAWGNGAFTKALVEGLGGKADYLGKGKITINMLDLYLSERVKELTKGKQTPTTTKPTTVPDFPVAVKKK